MYKVVGKTKTKSESALQNKQTKTPGGEVRGFESDMIIDRPAPYAVYAVYGAPQSVTYHARQVRRLALHEGAREAQRHRRRSDEKVVPGSLVVGRL